MNREPERDAWVIGITFLAAMVLLFLGICHLIMGLSAIFRDHLFLMRDIHDDHLLGFGVQTWGWIHLVNGIILLILGAFGVFRSARWVRPVAIVALILSAVTALAWATYLPFWAIPIMLLDVVLIWLLARPMRGAESRQT